MTMKVWLSVSAGIVLGLLGFTALSGEPAEPARQYTTWRDYGGSPDSMQYSVAAADRCVRTSAASGRSGRFQRQVPAAASPSAPSSSTR